MARILILGAGVMGSAIAVPAVDNGHQVTLVGTHLDSDIIAAMRLDRAAHPRLGAPLPSAVEPIDFEDLESRHFEAADLVILGVSSAGMTWATEQLVRLMRSAKPIALVTKGLVENGPDRPRTYVETLPEALRRSGLPAMPIVGIAGPCIARELAERRPTAVVYASSDEVACHAVAHWMQTPYYRVSTCTDQIGVEACAALKNFFAIGVSALWTRHARTDTGAPATAMNPAAAVFNQAVVEMGRLAEWIGGRRETAADLAGLGDLQVTVAGGRNSKLGRYLGEGMSITDALSGPLQGETVEGVDTGRCLTSAFRAAVGQGLLAATAFPLAEKLIETIAQDTPFTFDFERLGSAQPAKGG